ncbi:gamma-glutamylcyclotransferase [Roseomonas eburnea]|uniref:Gamma-glutamylcyclotransferase n=1 Tax=Neoroseomonas eburnea TaxID=1346889 RepID=A0A9X9XFT9_9PROT|nr:gamma-glutamylcyclotransferase family protein [Neoroseomonas eburnea]MBR0682575.1 gamma-glutamylcyclotransferase [Neoroseomonas eburnea]
MPDFLPEPYAAYGSNLWHDQMRRRCPDAEVVGSLVLPGWRLVLRKYALIARDADAGCPVGLWRIARQDLESLDRPEGPRTYTRTRIDLPGGGMAWTYEEIRIRPGPPAPEYVQRLRRGYRDFAFDTAPLEAAIAESGYRD